MPGATTEVASGAGGTPCAEIPNEPCSSKESVMKLGLVVLRTILEALFIGSSGMGRKSCLLVRRPGAARHGRLVRLDRAAPRAPPGNHGRRLRNRRRSAHRRRVSDSTGLRADHRRHDPSDHDRPRRRGTPVHRRRWEYSAELIAAVCAIAEQGPGDWSPDHALHIERSGPLWVTAAVGTGAAHRR
jgi:hypothetical protein